MSLHLIQPGPEHYFKTLSLESHTPNVQNSQNKAVSKKGRRGVAWWLWLDEGHGQRGSYPRTAHRLGWEGGKKTGVSGQGPRSRQRPSLADLAGLPVAAPHTGISHPSVRPGRVGTSPQVDHSPTAECGLKGCHGPLFTSLGLQDPRLDTSTATGTRTKA